jgi:hypothetical protein
MDSFHFGKEKGYYGIKILPVNYTTFSSGFQTFLCPAADFTQLSCRRRCGQDSRKSGTFPLLKMAIQYFVLTSCKNHKM